MSDISTENMYWCTLALKKDIYNKKNYKYIFAYKEKDNKYKTIFYDIIGKKYYSLLNFKVYNEDEYYVIDRVKLSFRTQNVKLVVIKKFLEYFDIFDKKIDEVCDNKLIKEYK